MRTRIVAGRFAFGWLILLLAACSAPPASALRLGTTWWTYQGASSVFTAAWSPDGKSLALAAMTRCRSGRRRTVSLC